MARQRPAEQVLSERLYVRVTQAEKAESAEAAEQKELTVSDYLRLLIFRRLPKHKLQRLKLVDDKLVAELARQGGNFRSLYKEYDRTGVFDSVRSAQILDMIEDALKVVIETHRRYLAWLEQEQKKMIGKVIPKRKRSSVSGLNDYVLNRSERANKEHKVICSGTFGIIGGIDTANEEMAAVAAQNRRCKQPIMHCLLSWREGESPSAEQVREAVGITLEELGLEGQQCVYALHGNTGNMHVHISVSRIDLQTHKAIDAAGGFTKKAMERAARRIEFTQGWAAEQNAWSRYDADMISVDLPKTRPETPDRDIPQTVKDIENLTGEKSALRIASEKLKGLEFSSWEELHEKLAELGMEYRKKGSGAVIFVGETPIKASAAGKRFGLNLLEKKLGEYREHRGKVEKKGLAPEPLTTKNDNGAWREYAAYKAEFIKNSGIVRKAMWAAIYKECDALKQAQKSERDAKINCFRWVGKRNEMNALRSQIAAKQAGERLDLKDRHDEMKRKLKQLYPPLPTYEEWLRDWDKDAEAEAWRHRAEPTAQSILIAPGEGAEPTGKEVNDIRGFKSKATDNGTMFYNPRTGVNAFRDSGKLIRIYDRDEATMLASMQLGMAKWGSIRIAGSEEYKARCVELAVEHGIKITNSELQTLYRQKLAEKRTAERATDEKLMKIDRAREDFKRYHEAIGADRYKVTATKIRPDGSKQGFMVNRKDGAPEGFTADEMDKKMRRLVLD